MFFFLASCASRQQEAKIERKVVAETQVTDGKSLGKTLIDTVEASKTLTEKQKQDLMKIIGETKARSTTLSQESFKLRSVLIKELLAKNVDYLQVKMIKKDIKKNEVERLKTTFSAIDRITKIVGKDVDQEVYGNILLDRHHF